MSKGGYQTAIWKLNAAAFGVPQERLRYFLVAARGRSLPAFPEVDYQASQQDEVPLDALPPVSLDEAIFDLPETAVARWTSDRATTDKRSRRYLSKLRRNASLAASLLMDPRALARAPTRSTRTKRPDSGRTARGSPPSSRRRGRET